MMGALCSIKNGKSNTEDAVEDGAYAFFDRSKQAKRSTKYLFDCEALIIPGEGTEFLPKQYNGKFDLHQRAYALFDFKGIDAKYLYYFLVYSKDYWPRVAVGATVKSLRLRHFENLPINYPPLPEQQRIVAKLDGAFAALGAAEAHVERNRHNARELFESYLNGVFEGATNRVATESLGTVVDFQGGSQPPKSEFIHEPREGYMRFLQIRDFKRDDKLTYIPISKKNRICEDDDIMLGRYGASVGNVLTGRSGAYNVALIKTIPSPKVNRSYLFYYLLSKLFQEPLLSVAARSAQDGFSKEDIYDFKLPVPDLAEQQCIASDLANMKRSSDAIETTYAQKLQELGALRRSLLGAAFRGEL
jgi:type I restriction enzyme S subunit